MTENKRFEIIDEHIVDNDGEIEDIWIETYPQAKKICKSFNYLADKIIKLKKDLTNNEVVELLNHNEQLKQQVTELSKENIHLDARVMDLQERLMDR